ncbi:hypothetical protein L6164_029582 [Bauhinia variegata]|uniref:Uncharacterized protein n=1 Tax=Bauhinia variegata TaxID=167791 RepID=A0ACB9L972_BAUVA|nr:hypothetical protein L6164_029582 [Bauhinia variegata]
MENRSTFLVCFSLGVFLLLHGQINAEENKAEPRKNVNLNPFQAWRSAYFCLTNNVSQAVTCSHKKNHTLTLEGWVNVLDSDIQDYCWSGCFQHTMDVLQCVRDVKKDFKFKNKAHIDQVWKTIHDACNNPWPKTGFNITGDPNSATSLYGRLYMPLVSAVATFFIIATFS